MLLVAPSLKDIRHMVGSQNQCWWASFPTKPSATVERFWRGNQVARAWRRPTWRWARRDQANQIILINTCQILDTQLVQFTLVACATLLVCTYHPTDHPSHIWNPQIYDFLCTLDQEVSGIFLCNVRCQTVEFYRWNTSGKRPGRPEKFYSS